MRIAMWSGPRNISTALMRSWGNRSDCAVVDEPLYAFYLNKTGLDHPGREETLATQPHDWQTVAEYLTGPIPGNKAIWYQKQMAHHLLPEVEQSWLSELENCFLIRDPREMLTSLIDFIPMPSAKDTGLPQQVRLFEQLQSTNRTTPSVIDSKDVLDDPRGTLAALCERLSVPFDDAMLQWPPGARATDGAWAPFWYEKVNLTSKFAPYRAKGDHVPSHLAHVYDECLELYHQLHSSRIIC